MENQNPPTFTEEQVELIQGIQRILTQWEESTTDFDLLDGNAELELRKFKLTEKQRASILAYLWGISEVVHNFKP